MTSYENRYWWSKDGLRLHARDYSGSDALPPILCLPGLTRNARDFEGLAEALDGRARVIAVSFRGRGESAYAKDPMTYVQDVEAMLDAFGITRFVAIGTSLGGIVTMVLAATARGRLAGAVLNDIGPEIEAAGLARIRGYVGKGQSFPTWLHAARCVQENNEDVYPGWGIEDWLAMAKRTHRLTSAGRIVLDYDLKIAEPFRVPNTEGGPDMWAALDALNGVPTLVVRGERSDILSASVAERMVERLSPSELVTVPNVGHTPLLTEPEALAGIGRLLDRVAG